MRKFLAGLLALALLSAPAYADGTRFSVPVPLPNAMLANSQVTIAGHAVSLGGSQTLACGDLTNAGTGCTAALAAIATSGSASDLSAGTVADARIASALTSKTYNGLTINTTTGTLALTNAKTLTVSNSMTLTATDGSTLAIGAGGTLAATAFSTDAANLSGTVASARIAGSYTGITGVGTIAAGTWNGTAIADAYLAAALTGKTYNGLTVNTTTGTLALTNAKTLTVSNSMTLTATDGSTLAIGAGGTLGSNAYTSTAYAALAGPTFTGSPVLSTPSATNINLTGSTVPANGWYLSTTNTLGVSVNTTALATMNASTFQSVTTGGFAIAWAAASSTVPTLIPNSGAGTTGFGASANGTISTIISGVEKGRWTSTGLNNTNIGATTIGTGAFSTLTAGTSMAINGCALIGTLCSTGSASFDGASAAAIATSLTLINGGGGNLTGTRIDFKVGGSVYADLTMQYNSGPQFQFNLQGTTYALLTSAALTITGALITTDFVQPAIKTVGTLGTCNTNYKGNIYYVTDALAPGFGVTLVAGGAIGTLALCDGSTWKAH